MCPIRRNSLLVHVAYPKYLGQMALLLLFFVCGKCASFIVLKNSMQISAQLAQLVARLLLSQKVAGSIPTGSEIFLHFNIINTKT